MSDILNIVIVGAHPDDCEIPAGGVTLRWRGLGHRVKYVSATNGDAGHHAMDRPALAARRYEETRRVAKVLDIEYEVMDIHDGQLEATLANREALIRILRRFEADLVITHRFDDYHPDHRNTAQLVADTAYMLNVPLCVADTPALRKGTVYCHFSRRADLESINVVVPVDQQIDTKLLAIHQNDSQVYEWIPWMDGEDPASIPPDRQGRLEYLRRRWLPRWEQTIENYRQQLRGCKPPHAAGQIRFIEAFVASPYGTPLTKENAGRYFPFPDAVIF